MQVALTCYTLIQALCIDAPWLDSLVPLLLAALSTPILATPFAT